MSIFDRLTKIAVEKGLITDDAQADSVAVVTPAPQPSAPVASTSFAPTTQSTPVATTLVLAYDPVIALAPDPETVKTLNDAVGLSKKPGYNEFRIIFDNMDGIPANQRYSMALKLTEATNKLSPATVIESLNDRLAILEEQRTQYDAAVEHETNTKVVGVQNDIKKLSAEIDARRAEIQKLETQCISMKKQADAAQIALERDRAMFSVSYEVVRSSIAQEKERISAYVPQQTVKTNG